MYSLKEFKEKFDPILEKFIDRKLKDFLNKTSNSFIKDYISYSETLIVNKGKRIRPYTAYLMYKTAGGKYGDEAIKLFIALEIFHAFCLIHDDVMDKGETRRGIKTIHNYIADNLKKENRIGDIKHIGNSQAILVGDLLFSWAIESFKNNKDIPSESMEKAVEIFYKMIDEVILGQMLDVDLKTRLDSNENLINEKIIMKTARYSFISPLLIGAALAGQAKKYQEFAEELGETLGIAFQTQDDLLDILGDENVTLKKALGDIAEGQHTFFTNYIFENGSETELQYFKSVFGKEIRGKDKEKIKGLFIKSGAVSKGEEIINQNLKKGKEIIKKSKLDEENKEYFLRLIEILSKRQS